MSYRLPLLHIHLFTLVTAGLKQHKVACRLIQKRLLLRLGFRTKVKRSTTGMRGAGERCSARPTRAIVQELVASSTPSRGRLGEQHIPRLRSDRLPWNLHVDPAVRDRAGARSAAPFMSNRWFRHVFPAGLKTRRTSTVESYSPPPWRGRFHER